MVDNTAAFHFRFPITKRSWISIAPEIQVLWMEDAWAGRFESLTLFGGVRLQLDVGRWSLALRYHRGLAKLDGDVIPLNHAGAQVGKHW